MLTTSPAATSNMQNLIPKPTGVTPADGAFILNAATTITVDPANDELTRIANGFADTLKPATGFPLPVSEGAATNGSIFLTLVTDIALGDEGYDLTTSPESITLRANKPAGLFYGTQTLRQLLPASINDPTHQTDTWEIAAGTIHDIPRFAWRGTMLDVSRHFFSVQDVKRYIDDVSHYKLNVLHLHLSDDQGWRIEIKSWDKLATYGGSTQVGGGKGGYYTQEEYSDLVNYAADHYMLVVPEIDMPGHTNAALASYPELNCDDTAPKLYIETQVGFSTLCIDKEITYKFIDDVVRELAALTPGPYIHIGGDETQATAPADYLKFIERVQPIVESHGKQMLGWEEIGQARLRPGAVVQQWHTNLAAQAADQGASVIMSPASKSYLDMKYDADSPLGLDWAGLVSVETAYTWEPVTEIEDLSESDLLGIEAPLWSETLLNMQDIEYMAFPRLLGIAEIGWSARTTRDWDEYAKRLATHGARLKAMGIHFYASPEVPWQ